MAPKERSTNNSPSESGGSLQLCTSVSLMKVKHMQSRSAPRPRSVITAMQHHAEHASGQWSVGQWPAGGMEGGLPTPCGASCMHICASVHLRTTETVATIAPASLTVQRGADAGALSIVHDRVADGIRVLLEAHDEERPEVGRQEAEPQPLHTEQTMAAAVGGSSSGAICGSQKGTGCSTMAWHAPPWRTRHTKPEGMSSVLACLPPGPNTALAQIKLRRLTQCR